MHYPMGMWFLYLNFIVFILKNHNLTRFESFSKFVIVEPSYPSPKISLSDRLFPICSRRIVDRISIIGHISNVLAPIDNDDLGLWGFIGGSSICQPTFSSISIFLWIAINDISNVLTAVLINDSNFWSCSLIHLCSRHFVLISIYKKIIMLKSLYYPSVFLILC